MIPTLNRPKTTPLRDAFGTRNFLLRFLTALIMGGLTLFVLLIQPQYMPIFMVLLLVGVIVEWFTLVLKSSKSPPERLFWLIFGSLYLAIGLMGFYQLYVFSTALALSLLMLIWVTDIGAYIVGKLCGGPKLAPSISPGKTISGAIGGTFFAAMAALVLSYAIHKTIRFDFVAFFIFCSLLSQGGDLLESRVKRHFQVKDSGKMLPGHGGLIDRLDSLLILGIMLYVFYSFASFSDIFGDIPSWT